MDKKTDASSASSAKAVAITNGASSSKPKKLPSPYSAYTIYFRLERQYILQSQCNSPPPEAYNPNHYDLNEHPRPAKYVNTKLPPFWYSSAHRAEEEKKRKHRKQEGGNALSKEKLTGLISQSWKNIDEDTLAYCKMLSMLEKRRLAANDSDVDGAAQRSQWQNLKLPFSSQRPPAAHAQRNINSSGAAESSGDNSSLSAEQKRRPLKKRRIIHHDLSTGDTTSSTVNRQPSTDDEVHYDSEDFAAADALLLARHVSEDIDGKARGRGSS